MRNLLSAVLVTCTPALASSQPTATVEAPPPSPSSAPTEEPSDPTVTVGGYVETYYQLHLQDPTNRTTALRGFDNRSRTFTLQNAVVDVKGEAGPVTARVILQVGHTGATYYLAEPVDPGGVGTNASSADLWKYLQQATLTGKRGDLTVEAGLFPSPIGIEVFAVKDNHNWSRSNLFYGLPFYHSGARASHALGAGWTGTLAAYSGWNSVVDNNGYPSVSASASYASAAATAQVLYFGGIERADGAAEGKSWRHLFDAYVQGVVSDTVTIAAQANAGIEPNDIGTSAWVAGALYGRLALSDVLYAAVRGDAFWERTDGASAIFWPVAWMASGTLTLAYQPVANASIRLEYRHDGAAGDAFYQGDVTVDATTGAALPDHDRQDTVTLGATAWF